MLGSPTGDLMDITAAFSDLQREVNADLDAVKEAQRRRDVFRTAFGPEADVDEVYRTGSLARGTMIEKLKDVDLLVLFDAAQHPEWGQAGDSAEDSLRETQERVMDLLGATNGSNGNEIRLTRMNDHAIKCFLDDPGDPDAFTVDVVPAIPREGGGFLIPEQNNRRWIETDPLYLIDCVAARHRDSGGEFAPLVRTLKRWTKDRGKPLKPLTLEVLALDHLPDGSRPEALQRFFTAAVDAVERPILDPAGLCGEVEPNLDAAAAKKELEESADLAWRAVSAQQRGETDRAACLWRKVFGKIFPEPAGGCGRFTAAAVAAAATPRRRVQDLGQG